MTIKAVGAARSGAPAPKAERGAWGPAPVHQYLVSLQGVIVKRHLVGGDTVKKKRKKKVNCAPSHPQS